MSSEAIALEIAERLSLADIAAIIRAKMPAKINGVPVHSISVTAAEYSHGKVAIIYAHAGDHCSTCAHSFEEAAAELKSKIGCLADTARQLRAQAAELIHRAELAEKGADL